MIPYLQLYVLFLMLYTKRFRCECKWTFGTEPRQTKRFLMLSSYKRDNTSRGDSLNPIDKFNPHTCLCLSQATIVWHLPEESLVLSWLVILSIIAVYHSNFSTIIYKCRWR